MKTVISPTAENPVRAAHIVAGNRRGSPWASSRSTSATNPGTVTSGVVETGREDFVVGNFPASYR